MTRYHFEILGGGATGAVERNVAIADVRGLWLRIGAIAKRQSGRGIIKVTDEMGGIVVLVGVATAVHRCDAGLLADYVTGLGGT